MHDFWRRARNRLQMDIAIESMLRSQPASYSDKLLHRVVRALNDSRAQKQSLDVIPPIKIERQRNDLFGRETRSPRIARDSIHAELAVVHAIIRQQNLQ